MAKGEDLQLQGGTAPEEREKGGQKRREQGAERESKEDRQSSLYQLDRSLREPQSRIAPAIDNNERWQRVHRTIRAAQRNALAVQARTVLYLFSDRG